MGAGTFVHNVSKCVFSYKHEGFIHYNRFVKLQAMFDIVSRTTEGFKQPLLHYLIH